MNLLSDSVFSDVCPFTKKFLREKLKFVDTCDDAVGRLLVTDQDTVFLSMYVGLVQLSVTSKDTVSVTRSP